MLSFSERDQAPSLHSYLNASSSSSARFAVERPRVLTTQEKFGRRIRTLRRELKLTQVAMADHLGVDRSFLSDLENGKKSVSLSYLETIAQGFKLSLSQLLTDL